MPLSTKQVEELNAAWDRAGGQTETDIKNFEYAKTQGWTPPVKPEEVNPGGMSNATGSISPTSNVAIRYPSPTTDEYGNLLKSRTTGLKSDAEIQAEERQRIQAQIDYLENYWANTIAPELQREGNQRLGETRAIGASAGLMGTPIGQAQKEKTQSYNTQISRAERAKIDAQISGLYAKADERAIDRAEKQATLLRTDQEAYQNYIKGQQEEARADLETMFKGGITLDELKSDPERYNQLMENSGIKDDFMAQAIYNANAPTEAKKDIKYQTVGDKVIGYYYDNASGDIKTIESDTIPGLGGGKYKTQVAGGTMLLIPENIDPNKPLDQQIIQYGKTGQFRAASGGGTSDEAKLIKEFKSNVAGYIEKIGSGDMDETTAIKALRAKYGDTFTDEELRSALGMGGEDTIRVIDEE